MYSARDFVGLAIATQAICGSSNPSVKRAQLIGIAVAGGAGLLAFILMRSVVSGPSAPTQIAVPVNATEVLVARRDIGLGEVTKDTDFRFSLVDAPGADSYPISSVTYLLVIKNQADPAKGKKLVDFIRWALHEGEADASKLDYAPLPPSIVAMLDARLSEVKITAMR